MTKRMAFAILSIGVACAAQARFQSGEFQGFTKSPTEHIISRLEDPFTVVSVQGFVIFGGKDEPLEDVLFEIRGPADRKRIRAAKTGPDGRFRIGRVPEGAYTFKATRDGFQSVVGALIVSKTADPQATIKIKMPIGV